MSHLATVNLALLLAVSIVTAAAGVFVWLRVRAPGAHALALLLLVCALNSAAFGLEFTTASLAAKGALEQFLTVTSAMIPTLWFVFALQYTGRGRCVTRTMIALLSVVPLISLLLAVSNDAHHLFWRDVSLAPGDAYLAADLVFGPAYWVLVVYANALLAAGTVLLLQLFRRFWNLYRGQAAILLVALSVPWIAQSMYLGGLSPVYGVDLVSLSICVAALLLAVGFTRLRAADVLSVSRAAILDSLVDAVMVLDPDANVLYSNPAGAAFLQHLGPAAIPEALVRVWPQAFDAQTGEPGRLAEFAATSWVDDDASVFDLSLSPVVEGGGQAVAKLLVVRDVTEQRRVEEAFRESEENFRTLFDTVDDLIVVATREGKIVHANRAVSTRLGHGANELMGMRALDLYPPDMRDAAEAIFAPMIEGERESCPLPLWAKSGALVPVDTRAWLSRWAGADCIFAVSRDLSKEQEALQMFEGLFRGNPALLALNSLPEGRYTEVNKAFLDTLGYSREEVLCRTSAELGLFVQPEIQRAVVEQLQAQGRVGNREMKVRRKDGTVFDGLFSGELIESQGQDSALTVMIDLTERKRAEEEIRRQAEQLRRTVEGAVLAMSNIIETRDPYTAGHERRVSELATAIGLDMGMEGEQITALRLGALIHDIGKVGVPAEILARPGLLSEVEFSLIKQHPTTGFGILGAIDFGLPVAEMVHQHHERLDGSGYPRGLAGEEILPEARILAVADVVEAMSSHRPYRAALDMAAALAEVRQHAGVKYDAEVVATCVRLVEKQGFQFTP
jgi:PAS domain S-box-containing protein